MVVEFQRIYDCNVEAATVTQPLNDVLRPSKRFCVTPRRHIKYVCSRRITVDYIILSFFVKKYHIIVEIEIKYITVY